MSQTPMVVAGMPYDHNRMTLKMLVSAGRCRYEPSFRQEEAPSQ